MRVVLIMLFSTENMQAGQCWWKHIKRTMFKAMAYYLCIHWEKSWADDGSVTNWNGFWHKKMRWITIITDYKQHWPKYSTEFVTDTNSNISKDSSIVHGLLFNSLKSRYLSFSCMYITGSHTHKHPAVILLAYRIAYRKVSVILQIHFCRLL